MRSVIAIDGPAGVGKSSVSRRLAEALGWTYLDTGAMYRALTLAWLEAGGSEELLADADWIAGRNLDMAEDRVLLDGRDVSEAIREARVNAQVSLVAAAPKVRANLTAMQRRIGDRRPCVLDGRDIGTVVFPDAFFKVFLTASDEVRARRRWLQEGGEQGQHDLAEILADLRRRDQIDSSRALAPLRQAPDALAVDTDDLDEDGVLALLREEAQKRLEKTR